MKKERLKLFFVKHKWLKIIIILLMITTVSIAFKIIYNELDIEISEKATGVIGTLSGAIVGGVFTLLGSILINRKVQKAQSEIRRKNLIYKPLYDELVIIHDKILKENPYPTFVSFDKDMETLFMNPQYTAWGRIKKDSRIFEVPKKLKISMDNLYQSINIYLEKRIAAVNALGKICKEEIKRLFNVEINSNANIGDQLLSFLLLKKLPNDELMIWINKKYSENERDLLWRSISDRANTNDDIKALNTAKNEWYKKEEFAINLIATYIQIITNKYEG